MMFFETYAYTNKLKAIPMEKFIFAMLTMLICLVSDQKIIHIMIGILIPIIISLRAKIPIIEYIKMFMIPLSFLIISVITILITLVEGASDTLIYVKVLGYPLGITHQSLDTALGLMLKSLGTVSCLYFLAFTTPMVQIINVLKSLKIPLIMVELMGLIYKSIFVLFQTGSRIYTSQDARLGYSTVRRGYHSLGQLASTLFIRSLHRSNSLYMSLESRGYDGELRVLEKKYRYSFINILSIIIIDGALILLTIFA